MDFPQTTRKGFLASPGFQINAAITGYTQRADDQLRVIDLKKRLCTTSQEITLKYFENYTRPYCQLDCLTRFFLAECFCVPYYFPGKYVILYQQYSALSYFLITLSFAIDVQFQLDYQFAMSHLIPVCKGYPVNNLHNRVY